MADIFRPPFFQPDSINGIPLAGAKLYFYTAGTSTLITVYQDFAATTPHASPVVADSSGIFPNIYVASPSFKIALYTSLNILVKTVDNIDNFTDLGMVNVKDYGAVGDGVTNDYDAIIRARDVAISTSSALGFPSGDYVIGSTLDLTSAGLKILALGNCSLTHTGTGRAVTFDTGGPEIFDQVFGGPNAFYINGNSGTTDLLYTNHVSHSHFKANVRNGSAGWRNGFSVCNTYDITCSSNEGAFTTRPFWGAFITDLYDSQCRLVIEGCGGSGNYGFHLTNSDNNTFYGTSEGNLTGGAFISSSALRNSFIGFDCESNTALDWSIAGSTNTFIGTVGFSAASTGESITGSNNVFTGCLFTKLNMSGNENTFTGGNTTLISNSGTGNVIKRDVTAADINDNAAVPVMGHVVGAVAAGATKYFVHALLDATNSNVYIPLPEAGSFSNMTISSDAAPGVGQTYVFTLQKLNSDTALTCTISGNASNQASDSTHSVVYAAGNIWSIKVVVSGGATAIASILFGMSFTPS